MRRSKQRIVHTTELRDGDPLIVGGFRVHDAPAEHLRDHLRRQILVVVESAGKAV